MLQRLGLEGKVAVVTGGGTGLGRAVALHLARAGSDLVVAGRRLGPLETTAAEARQVGRRALAVPTDIADSSQVDRLVETTIRELGRLDVLVNNAGVPFPRVPKPIWDLTNEEWQFDLQVNLTGAVYCSRAAAKAMAQRGGGVIINVSSGYGLRGMRDYYGYTITKGALIQLTRTLAVSLARHNIRCNCIVPGHIPTPGTIGFEDYLPRAQYLPVQHLGKPDDIGPLAVFLASDASRYMNGELLMADGGGLVASLGPLEYAPVQELQE
ncbi:MAG: SDR family oxidoreductase [Chloroflexi bacterium]|nr:SDR family oxidoreductase [Chloroflexota bacterium]